MKLGALDISTVKLGANQVQAVYLGNNLVWQNAPVAIAATGVGTTSFTANWNAYSGATYYLLDVSESSDFSTFVYEDQQVNAPSTSYVVIGLNPNTTYYYRVRASTDALPFEFTVDTTIAGSSGVGKFQLPLINSLALNAVVNWGDGNSDTITTYNQAQTLHTYSSGGIYTISISGTLNGWSFNNVGDKLKMKNVISWGILLINASNGFDGCTNFTCSATDAPTITLANWLAYFRNCNNFNGQIGNWNMVTATFMSNMFQNCFLFNGNIGLWNVSNVTSMDTMMRECDAFNQNISSWNIKKVTAINNFLFGTPGVFSTANYDALLVSWNAQVPKTGIAINFGASKYTLGSAAATARASLISTYGWTITDGGGI